MVFIKKKSQSLALKSQKQNKQVKDIETGRDVGADRRKKGVVPVTKVLNIDRRDKNDTNQQKVP